ASQCKSWMVGGPGACRRLSPTGRSHVHLTLMKLRPGGLTFAALVTSRRLVGAWVRSGPDRASGTGAFRHSRLRPRPEPEGKHLPHDRERRMTRGACRPKSTESHRQKGGDPCYRFTRYRGPLLTPAPRCARPSASGSAHRPPGKDPGRG